MLAVLLLQRLMGSFWGARWATTAKRATAAKRAHQGGTVHGCRQCRASRKAQVLVQQKCGIFRAVYGTVKRKKGGGEAHGHTTTML